MFPAIELVPHDPEWSSRFREEMRLLLASLGDRVAQVHHVGSTAIPHIRAKPIVDIAVESREYPPDASTIAALGLQGYQHHGESGVEGRHWFTKGAPRSINLHWCPCGGSVVNAQIRFRDRLIADPALAREYEALKMAAAPGQEIDSKEYADAKAAFIHRIVAVTCQTAR